jgi:hypothetical protein
MWQLCDQSVVRNMYRPPHHKNAHRGKDRVIAIGPKARALLESFTPARPDAYYFSPQADVELFHAERSERRVTPLYPSHARRNTANRTAAPKRPIGERYTTAALGRAVAAAVIRANVEIESHRAERAAGRALASEPITAFTCNGSAAAVRFGSRTSDARPRSRRCNADLRREKYRAGD